MTAPRLARASRSRFFIGFFALLLMIGFVAIFHSSQQQLDESRELTIRCEQREEALNARMQAVVEHKFRLEKTLESERKEHLETKQNYEQRAKEEKEIHSKATMESGVRFESMQQHYKLLQSEHNDLVEDCVKAKESQLEQINGQERKVKSLQTQLLQAKSEREKDIEHWKIKYENLENEKNRIVDRHSSQLELLTLQIKDYKAHCSYRAPPHYESTESNLLPNALPLKSADLKDFKEQIAIIPKPLVNGGGGSDPNSQGRDENKEVLQQPPPLKNPYKSSTSPTDLKSPVDLKKSALSVVSSTSEKTKRSSTVPNGVSHRNHAKQLPLGVAPVPDNFDELLKNDEKNDSGNNNNRYANVVDELSGKKDDTEQENGAHEIKDNDFNLGDDKNDDKDRLQEVLDNVNNAAEDDTNNFLDAKPIGRVAGGGGGGAVANALSNDGKKDRLEDGRDDDEIHVVGNNKHGKVGGPDGVLQQHEGDDKLINEVVGDQGKEAAFADGLHMEEQNEEDEEDEDEYSDPAARQQEGLAVRN